MNKNSVTIISIICLSFFACVSKTENKEKLSETLNKYTVALKNQDYIKMSEYMLPEIIKPFGSPTEFERYMKASLDSARQGGVSSDFSEIKIDSIGDIIGTGDVSMAVIRTTLPITINNTEEGLLEGCTIGVSKDNGKTWNFIDGDDYGVNELSKLYPDVIKLISIPSLVLKINADTFVRQNGKWVKE